MKKLSTQDFIHRARNIHGGEFDYGNVKYVTLDKRVEIACSLHGIFTQKPMHHLRGHKCPSCRNRASFGTSKKYSDEDTKLFVAKALKVHGGKYDYSSAVYSGTNAKIAIICSIHGKFFQTPHNHLRGAGCGKCSVDVRSHSLGNFISTSNKIHGERYDYSEFVYVNSKVAGTIICNIHGRFRQTPNAHLYYGCKRCTSVGGYCESWFFSDERRKRKASIYVLRFCGKDETFYKIGITTRIKRFGKRYKGYDVQPIHERQLELYDAFKVEQHVLNTIVKDFKYIPSNFPTGNGKMECFKACELKIQQIKEVIDYELHRQNKQRR